MRNIFIMSVLCVLISCNMQTRERKKYRPEAYFGIEERPMAEAVYYGDKKRLKNLMSKGMELNHVGKEGLTYLMFAIKLKDYEMTRFLPENGADPNQLSPLMKHKGNVLAFRKKEDWSPLKMLPIVTCCDTDYPIKYMKLLVKYGADVNDDRAGTPLDRAILSNDMEKIKYLVACGADINKPFYNKNDNTPIITAAIVMSFDVVNYLLDCGADVFYENRRGYSVGYYIQDYRENRKWTPAGEKKLDALIERLKAKGVKFPIPKPERKPAKTPKDTVSEAEKAPEKQKNEVQATQAAPHNRHSWILDDDDDNNLIVSST